MENNPINKNTRARAIASKSNNVGLARYHIYRQAYKRINQSIENGYYLEAITLIESLISDRLESRLSYLLKKDYSFKTLGALITKAKQFEENDQLKTVVSTELDHWREKRNAALHEMVKIEDGEVTAWEERYSELRGITITGKSILRKIDKLCKKKH